MDVLTPDQVAREILRISQEAAKAPEAIYAAESKLAELERDFERTLQLAFMNAQGTVADRTALSRYEAADARFQADLARAELNRIKAKAKQLSEAGILMATIAKTVDLTYRS